MNQQTPEQLLKELYSRFSGLYPMEMSELPPSGSYRRYFRLKNEKLSLIGTYNEDQRENIAFVEYSKHFFSKGLPVPQIYFDKLQDNIYLQKDLGDVSLLQFINEHNEDGKFTEATIDMYKKVLACLPRFQIQGHEGLNYDNAYPRQAFDRQSMMWDLNYFKYYFLKLAKVPFNEQLLEDDFNTFVDFLLSADCDQFLFRDFQSRNVMIVDNEPFFIDYQGGRQGALQYDVASILFEAKTAIPADLREILLNYYLSELQKYKKVDKQEFVKHFYAYVFIRLMQAMGAYGFRGLYEKKTLFLQSIPKSIEHLRWLLEKIKLPIELPELSKVWKYLTESDYIVSLANKAVSLSISINSFSYRRGIPYDASGNGGGFVFDCRGLDNPGRLEQYKLLTGKDQAVIDFLEKLPYIESFINGIYVMVDLSIDNYAKKGYTNLMINFGCTGGQHRSVYCAERLSKHLKKKYPDIAVSLRHREQE